MQVKIDKGPEGGMKKSTRRVKSPVDPGPDKTLPIIPTRELPRLEELAPAAAEPAPAAVPAAGARKAAVKTSGASGTSGTSGAAGVTLRPDLGEPVLFEAPGEDTGARARYESARQAAETLAGQAPQYDSRYDAQIQSLYEQIVGRGPFRYDAATDPLYQRYAQDYTMRGRLAMRDTMGQAAALTGGYGSSYAQSVGEQQYDSYLRRLGEILPQTYALALEAYEAEGEGLQKRLQTTEALEQSDYARYLDELGQHNLALERADRAAENAYDRMVSGEERAYRRAADDYARRAEAEETSYARRQAYYKRLVSLIAAGYTPNAEDYALAGMSAAQGKALVAKYRSSARSSRGGKKKQEQETAAANTLRKNLSGDTKTLR